MGWGTNSLRTETAMQDVLVSAEDAGRTDMVMLFDSMEEVESITVMRTGLATLHPSDAEPHLQVRYGAIFGVRVPS